ncbi:MAG: TetR/AcrR family transcriptional regulator [Candidatus Bipolaricaulis sp.]|nr:TetR/AcrR family transcriptional regulator [Candidatus Bipolaricaulis sp.]
MARAFTGLEKETIRARLMEAGLACFTRYGLKKTTIEDLTKPVKISKAAFYHFFPSKEALYAELLLERFPAMQRRVVDRSLRATKDTREAIVRFQRELVKEMEADDLIRPIILNPSELEQIIHGVPDGMRSVANLDLGGPVFEWIRDAQARGEIIDGDPEVVGSMLGLVKFLPTHQDDIDPVLYPRLLEAAINVVADGLTSTASSGKVDRPTARTSRRQAPAARTGQRTDEKPARGKKAKRQ